MHVSSDLDMDRCSPSTLDRPEIHRFDLETGSGWKGGV